MLKDHILDVLPYITSIVNSSLQSGVFPAPLKQALVTPLLKKSNLDVNNLNNFRPVSNLPFMGKIIERAAINQLQQYIADNDLHSRTQSAYRKFHSVETAIVRVTNDLLNAVDDHGEAILILLDLSAAFDTVDHPTLLNRLQQRFGVNGKAYQFFASYLTNRTQSVIIDGTTSDPTKLEWGVPQGSVVGPVLFNIYSSPIEDIIQDHGVSSVSYADDTQLYVLIKPSDRSDAIDRLSKCVDDIRMWMAQNKLKLNDSKTELLHIRSRFAQDLPDIDIKIGINTITSSDNVRNLGVIFDKHLTMSSHINAVCRSASYAIYRIGKLRRYLDKKNTEKLVHAFVTSRIDNCNSILFGLPDKDLNKLQRIQNSAARIVTLTRKHDHITPIMFNLHWLPLKQRIIYKLLLLTFKALHGLAPTYITDLITPYKPPRTLRSSTQHLLKVIPPKSVTYGRSFAVAAPLLWNKLPLAIRGSITTTQFQKRLKTHLFKTAYN